jgi:plasmid stabilization system protein ParE
MTKPWSVDAEAAEELRLAMRWYEQQREGLGTRLLDDFEATLETLREQPTLGVPPPGASRADGGLHVLLRVFPYSLLYVELESEYRVVGLYHGRRIPEIWLRRVREWK